MTIKWHEEARQMRASGAKLSDIGRAFGVSTEWARRLCMGITCPVDHTAYFRDPEWRARNRPNRSPKKRLEREAFLREHYKQDMTAAEIGKALGITRNAVISSANGLGLCTPSAKSSHS